MKTQPFQTIHGSVVRHKMVATEHGSRSQPSETIAYTAEIFLDGESLTYLCNRAALNKTGKAKAGPVSIKITSRKSRAYLDIA